MLNAIICIPTAGRTYDDIVADRAAASKAIEAKGQYAIRDSLVEMRYPDETLDKMGVIWKDMFYLSKALELTSGCDMAYFTPGWAKDKQTKTLHDIAQDTGLEIVEA